MPTLTIDGQEITVEAGTTVIQAAEKLGIYIPRYCYHPGLSIAGSCRMCLVEIENLPKLQIGCYTAASDGMSVRTTTDTVKNARKHMLEFLLTNHPLDCPVCDQSGECDLQNFYMEYGRYESRFIENKIKRKKAHTLGPHVMLDQERCILCSRCIRFTEEVSKSNELGIFNRGNRSVVDVRPGMELNNAYSGNVIDICPVGALTEQQFRFKCRVWYLSTAKSVCTGCSQGCNITMHYNGSHRSYKADGRRIQRYKPRFNPDVNQWWMCDEGRFGFEFIDENRIEFPYLRQGGQQTAVGWDEALAEVSTAIRTALHKFGPESVFVAASPRMTNEELVLTRELFQKNLGVKIGIQNPAELPGTEDQFLVKADKNPNLAGARLIRLEKDLTAISENRDQIKVLVVFQHHLSDASQQAALGEIPYTVFIGPNWNETAQQADAVLASATHAEKEGTFTNHEGRIQHFEKVVSSIEDSREDFEILMDLSDRLEVQFDYQLAEDVYRDWQGKSFDEIAEFGDVLEPTGV